MNAVVPYKGIVPRIHPSVYVAPNTSLIGDVHIAEQSSIWFGAVIRGDVQPIHIGPRTSIQDNTVVHATIDWWPTVIGADVTVGHACIIHGCTIADRVLIGMGSIILDEAEIGSDTVLGAGSLVTARTKIPPGVLALGRPAKVIRELTDDERQSILDSANRYIAYSREYVIP